MDIRMLLEEWNRSGAARRTAREYRLRLPVHDAARIAALADMYPRKTEEQLLAELLSKNSLVSQVVLPSNALISQCRTKSQFGVELART